MKAKQKCGVILSIAIGTSFLINSIMFTWEATRRSADDQVKINISMVEKDDSREKEDACIRGGGRARR